MKKDNVLYAIIGLLAGLIIGFIFTNSINKSAVTNIPAGMNQNAPLPPGHPEVPGQTSGASPEELQAAAEKAKNEPKNFDVQMKAAELYYRINRYDEAIGYLKKANELKPDDYTAIVGLGNANFDANRFEEAEKWYSSALEKKADDVNVRTDLGLTFMFRAQPDYDRAVKEFLKSLEVNPQHPQTLQNLTVAYTKKGETEKASETLSKLEGLDPGNTSIPQLRQEIQKTGSPKS
jgi:tetratricopeptide (TPR) repeat protein